MKQLLNNNVVVEVINDSLQSVVNDKMNAIGKDDKDDAYFVVDLGDIVRKYRIWQKQLPRIMPYYAVKCNDDIAVLALLAQLGTGFDCASKAEIQKILDLNVPADRIIYANPCKQASHIKYAAKVNVPCMTFDNETELYKIKGLYPTAKLVIRIAPPDDSKSQCPLGMKFGCGLKEVAGLLRLAKQLSLDIIGVSFHVGSGCYDATAFAAAVVSARAAFDIGIQEGFHFDLLDIGGGFPGQESAKISFDEICASLRPALDLYFPESSGVRIIAEPGRFFVASAFTIAVNVIAKRVIPCGKAGQELTANDQPAFMYYVNDGVYGSFNCLLYDHAEVEPSLTEDYSGEAVFVSSIWGPTCDGLDCIKVSCLLPELEHGDWLVFNDMGAYTTCAASTFNGMPKPRFYYVAQEAYWEDMKMLQARKGEVHFVSRNPVHVDGAVNLMTGTFQEVLSFIDN